MSNRISVVNTISTLLERECAICPIRAEYYKKFGNKTSKLDKHCGKACSVGQKLQELGKQLSRKG
jgi:hypothetical protein